MPIECERWQWRELFASEHGPPDAGTRLVLFALSLHMNQEGDSCFPSQELIVTRTGLSARSVRNHLKLAEELGWIEIQLKRRPGQAWFNHSYGATIPNRLAQYCTSKPWEEDPKWRRAANSAGRQTEPKRRHPAKSAGRNGSQGLAPMVEDDQRPANPAEHPATIAERPANNDTTGGNLRHDARQPLPLNSPYNSSGITSNNTPTEGAAASSSTAMGNGLKKLPRTLELTGQERLDAARKLAIASGMETARKQYRLTETEIEEIRRP